MEGVPEDMWSPYKQLYSVLQSTLLKSGSSNVVNLDICLKKYKQNFANFLRNPPKNEKSRTYLRNCLADGVVVTATGRKLNLSKELVDEAFIISDMFDMDELISLELLVTAQRQLPHYPGLPRGLVAVLLYYDGRKAITCTLRDLFQAASGVSWSIELPREITGLISSFTQNLVIDANILGRIIELLDDQLDITRETELLTKNRAFGPKNHQNQVLGIFEDIRLALAMSVFNWSAQRGLPKAIALRLIQYLSKYKTSEATGLIDNVALTLLMALIYGFDTSVLQRQEDNSTLVQRLPIFNDLEFAQQIYDKLMATTGEHNIWQYKGLESFVKFCFGLSLASLRHAPANLQMAVNLIIGRDEQLIDDAIAYGVFEFMHYNLLEKQLIFETEFFYRGMHMILTDFISLMHSKVTELRGRADETSRTVNSFRNEGLEPPANLDNNFEMLMLCIGKLYKRNSCGLALCDEYWGPLETAAGISDTTTTRSVSLFKFIRLAGELLPKTLCVSYLSMIAGLTSSERSARNAFNLLKQTSNSQSTSQISWEHFFASIRIYFANLRQECYLTNDTIYRNRSFNRCINPQDVECFQAVLGVIKAVTQHDEVSRFMICQHPNWTPVQLLLGLLGCSVPLTLKAEILFTLAAMARSVETAITIWSCLEDSQIIPTVPPIANFSCQSSLTEEIEQNECRAETYALSRGILHLLKTLVDTYMPRNLGLGTRKAGFDPYYNFVMQTIFLKFYNRTYKSSAEKWQVGALCVKLLHQLVVGYDPNPEDFTEQRELNANPGYHIMLQLHIKGDVLRLILQLVEDARMRLDDFTQYCGKEEVEDCALYCLLILEQGLVKQNAFFEAHSLANSAILLSGLNRMLMDINPRSRQPDYVLNLTKFVTYNGWLPRHSLTAVKILNAVVSLPNVGTQLLGMCGQPEIIKLQIRQGFVECLELDVTFSEDDVHDENHTLGTDKSSGSDAIGVPIELQIKTAIVEFFQSCIGQPTSNIVHFLLGFEHQREGVSTGFGGATSIGSLGRHKQFVIENGVHCTKSLVYLLELSLEQQQMASKYNAEAADIVERVWQLIYNMYANRRTSDAILRYFRTHCNDFLLRHLAALPQYKFAYETSVLNQMSHMLKCVAIELKLIAYHGQISRFHSICEILVGNTDGQQRHQNNMPIEYANFLFQLSGRVYQNNNSSNSSKTAIDNAIKTPSYTTQGGLHLCRLLDYVSLEFEQMPVPKFEYFDGTLLTQILKECEVKLYEGHTLVNIKRLHRILNDELTTVQSTIVTGQRQLIMQEIRAVLLHAISVNRIRSQRYATCQYMTAWSQLTQALFTCVPNTALPLSLRKQHIIEILERILCKIVPTQPLLEIAILCTDTLLLLLAHLRYCYYQLEDVTSMDNEQERLNNEREIVTTETIMNRNASKSHTAHLRYILKNLLEWIMLSDVTSQKLRINLYTALINCLRIVKRHRSIMPVNQPVATYVSLLDKSQEVDPDEIMDRNQLSMAVEVVSTFGDKLIDTFCHDAIMGHDICRMLALSCIDLILELNPVPSVISFIATHGYLTHIIEGLRASDKSLCFILRENPDNMKALYTYESKMAFLLRFASSHVGAELLLSEQFLSVLSDMKVYDMQPDLRSNALQQWQQQPKHDGIGIVDIVNGFVPNIDERYRAILFPALDVCNCLITVLGTNNNSVCAQVLNFLFAHGDLVESILRAGTPYMSLGLLETLSALTNLIARTATRDITYAEDELLNCDEPNYDRDLRNRINRIQQLMITLFGRFVVSQRTIKDTLKRDHVTYELTEEQKNLHVKYFLEVTANLVLYCRNIVTCRTNNSRTSKLLLTTLLSDLSQLNGEGNDPKKLTTVLNIILNQLKGVVEYYPVHKTEADNLMQQRTSLLSMSFEPNAKQRYMELTQRYNNTHTDLTLVVLIAEQSLYLLWLHLDYYLRRAVIFNLENKNIINDDNAHTLTATYDEILGIKKIMLSTFNETFCKQLLSTSELSTASKGFSEALLRRIKSLIQFVPAN